MHMWYPNKPAAGLWYLIAASQPARRPPITWPTKANPQYRGGLIPRVIPPSLPPRTPSLPLFLSLLRRPPLFSFLSLPSALQCFPFLLSPSLPLSPLPFLSLPFPPSLRPLSRASLLIPNAAFRPTIPILMGKGEEEGEEKEKKEWRGFRSSILGINLDLQNINLVLSIITIALCNY